MEKSNFSILSDNRKAIYNILEEIRNNNMIVNPEQMKVWAKIAESQETIKMREAEIKNMINEIF